MNDILENKMLLETAAEPQEQDPDEAYDQQRADEDHAELKAELLRITRLQSVTAELERLTQGLQGSLLGRRQAE